MELRTFAGGSAVELRCLALRCLALLRHLALRKRHRIVETGGRGAPFTDLRRPILELRPVEFAIATSARALDPAEIGTLVSSGAFEPARIALDLAVLVETGELLAHRTVRDSGAGAVILPSHVTVSIKASTIRCAVGSFEIGRALVALADVLGPREISTSIGTFTIPVV